jgi:hypothetical protein
MTVKILLAAAPFIGAVAAVILIAHRKVTSDSDTVFLELQVIQLVESMKEARSKCRS